MPLPRYAMHAWVCAAQAEISRDGLWAWSVWFLVVLETVSMLLYIQFATITHSVLVLIPVALLLCIAVYQLRGDVMALAKAPLYLVWPRHFSRLALVKPHTRMVACHFYAATIAIKFCCCAIFWYVLFGGFGLPQTMDEGGLRDIPMLKFDDDDCRSWAGRYEMHGQNCTQYRMVQLTGESIVVDLIHDPTYSSCSASTVFSTATRVRICRRCKYRTCSSRYSPVPAWLVDGCDRAFFANVYGHHLANVLGSACALGEDLASCPTLALRYNTLPIRFAICQLVYDSPGWAVPLWRAACMIILYLPGLSFLVSLTGSLTLLFLQYRSVGSFGVLGSAPFDPDRVNRVMAEAQRHRKQMLRQGSQASQREKMMLHFNFSVYILDCATDINCFVQFLRSWQLGLALAQGIIIAVPLILDCYRGKIGPVEAYAGLIGSRKKGYPTNEYLQVLNMEKGAEAPLSLALQFFTLFRATSQLTFWSSVVSMLLSFHGISKFIYHQFELGLQDAMVDEAWQESQPEVAGSDHPSSDNSTSAILPVPFMSNEDFSRLPPGLSPSTPSPACVGAPATSSFPVVPPGINFGDKMKSHMPVAPSETAPVQKRSEVAAAPIQLGENKIRDTE
mmetsp:Transcript_11403/g.27358  ORF Transcript_11403/g.27358 Transcript_11403/m.27358 type:complete len:618 (+) Transcript_11403:61-1914(+)